MGPCYLELTTSFDERENMFFEKLIKFLRLTSILFCYELKKLLKSKTNLTLTLFKTDFFLNIKYNFEINSKIKRINLISKLTNYEILCN